MKNWILLLALCSTLFAATTVHETEPNDDWENADEFIFGDSLMGSHTDAESTWQDTWVATLDQFGVVTITVEAGDGLTVAPCLWEGEAHRMLSCDWTEYGGSDYDQEYLFPGTYHLDMPGSKEHSAGHSIDYNVYTTFQPSPSVKEVEPNNEHAGANTYQLGEEMTGVWSEEDFGTGGQTSHDYFKIYLIPGIYEANAEFDPAVCFGIELQKTDGGRVFQVDEDTVPRMWYWREGEGSKSAQYEITEGGNYFIYAETEGCHFKTSEEDEYNYLLIPYSFTFGRIGDLPEEEVEDAPEAEVPDTVPDEEVPEAEVPDNIPDEEIPEPTLYDEEVPEPTLYEDEMAPPAPPECESNSDCASGACINGYCYVESGCPYECCDDLDCERLADICVNNECVDAFSDIDCGEKTCPEGEFLNSVCECTPLGGGVIDPCCGTAFALIAVVGFAIRKG